MRFQRHLNEALTADQIEKVRYDIYPQILKDCQPYLKALKGQYHEAMRGHRSTIKVWSKRKVRQDRKPLETDKRIHDLADKLFQKKFGLKPRSQAAFSFSDLNKGFAFYGDMMYFYPIGNFKFLWSKEVKDLTLHLTDREHGLFILEPSGEFDDDMWTLGAAEKVMKNIVDTYQTTDLHAALKTRHEIAWFCKEYYLVHPRYHLQFYDIETYLGL